jgi:peptidoglycan/LPS O-acetylase OafA/YrhL
LFPSLRERESLAPLWKYLTFTQNIGLDLRYQVAFSHAWSLCIEEQFYLLLPIILIALVYFKAIKKGLILLLLFFLFGFLVRLYSWHTLVAQFGESDDFGIYWLKWIYYPTYCRLDGLLIGVSIAAIFQFRPKLKEGLQKYGNLLFLISLFILAAAYFLCLSQESFNASIFGFPLVSVGYGIMVLGAVSPTSFLFNLHSRSMVSIATFSYGIYLSHKIIIHTTREQFSKFNISKESNLMFLICIITSLLAAFILNKLIEKPFLKLKDKILQAKYFSR